VAAVGGAGFLAVIVLVVFRVHSITPMRFPSASVAFRSFSK